MQYTILANAPSGARGSGLRLQRSLLCTGLLLLSLPLRAESQDWSLWLAGQIQEHPEVQAAREQLSGSLAVAEASEQPLYNPELSAELERAGDADNYRLGIAQTIDWWDRRGAQQQQVAQLRTLARQQYRQVVLDRTAQALTLLVDWQAAEQAAGIAQTQAAQLETLLDLLVQRQRAGDLGSIDAEFAFLALAQRMAVVAAAEAALRQAETGVQELLPGWSASRGGVPEAWWAQAQPASVTGDPLQHPVVAAAHAQWQASKEGVEVTRRALKAQPTLGLDAGREDSESVVGFSVSIPLNLRNDFSAERRAAGQVSLEAEARFRAAYRKQQFALQAAREIWERYAHHHQRWRQLTGERLQSSAELLQRQWQSGDLATAEYLQALSLRADSLLAGIELEKQTRRALTAVLQHAGQLHINPPTAQ